MAEVNARLSGTRSIVGVAGGKIKVTAQLGKRKFRGISSELDVYSRNILCTLTVPVTGSGFFVQRKNAMVVLAAPDCESSFAVALAE